MRGSERCALVLGAGDDRIERLLPLLERAGIAVRRADRAAEAQPIVLEGGTDLLVVALPARGAERVLAALRVEGSASRRAGALVLGPGDGPDASSCALGRMANRMLAADCPSEELELAVASLLGVAPRVRLRPGDGCRLRIEPARELEVTNLSVSGLLVRADEAPPLGAEVAFELTTSAGGEPVRGGASVLRHAPGAFALRFVGLEPGATERLRALVEREAANAAADDQGPRTRPVSSESSAAEARSPSEASDEILRRGLASTAHRPLDAGWLAAAAELGLEPSRSAASLLEAAAGPGRARA